MCAGGASALWRSHSVGGFGVDAEVGLFEAGGGEGDGEDEDEVEGGGGAEG